jgi:surfeit locus 1 family protein
MSWSAFSTPLKKNTRLQSAMWFLLALLCVAITCSLGFWQLGRAQTKIDWQAEITQKAQMPLLEGSFLGGPQDSQTNRIGLLHRPIKLEGEWLDTFTVYLDNRQMNARPGFYVMTPFKVQATGAVVLVQRGWVGRDFTDRTRLPAIQTPTGAVVLHGLIALPPSKLYALGEEAKAVIRQNLDLQDFRVETGLPLLEISVIQVGAASEGLLREWPQAATGVEKHHGYAFQWFGLALLIALLYVWFQIVRPRITSKVTDSH